MQPGLVDCFLYNKKHINNFKKKKKKKKKHPGDSFFFFFFFFSKIIALNGYIKMDNTQGGTRARAIQLAQYPQSVCN